MPSVLSVDTKNPPLPVWQVPRKQGRILSVYADPHEYLFVAIRQSA